MALFTGSGSGATSVDLLRSVTGDGPGERLCRLGTWPAALRSASPILIDAEQLRGTCPFSYGSTINFGERIAPESEMTAFCVFAPLTLDRDDYLGIDIGIPGHESHDVITIQGVINIQGMYPIHEVERQFINERGPEAFWKSDWEPTDVLRRPAT